MRLGIEIDCLQNKTIHRTGVFRHVLGLLTGLAQLDPRPEVTLYFRPFTAEGESRMRAVLLSQNVAFPIRRFYRPLGRPYNLRMRLNSWRAALHRLDVFQVITERNYRIYPAQLRAVLIPDLSVLHAPEHHTEENKILWREMFEHAQNHADLVVTYSEHTRLDVATNLGIPVEKIVAVPLAADPCFRPLGEAEVRAKLLAWGLEYRRYLFTVSTIEPRKNHRALFRAYAQYRQRAGKDCLPLVVAGAPGWLHDEILAEPARLGIAEAVRFVGRVEGLEYLYNGATAFVYPSLFEGFGLPPLEAMACGTPVVASNATSLPEVVQDAGLMFDPLDDCALSEHIIRITSDPVLREDLAARGLEVARQFSWRRTAELYVAALRNAAEQRNTVGKEVMSSCT
ncbi:MAG TPA: glycosyltransferase family 1 protein [Gemmataceae bacterium]|jgi:glycosyltransferase involved in cell wall biosynthesis|nr:glycosyltransferase family 1 protein [Gemmataceae bacterium]